MKEMKKEKKERNGEKKGKEGRRKEGGTKVGRQPASNTSTLKAFFPV